MNLDYVVLVEITVPENDPAAISPVPTFVIGDKYVCTTHVIQLVITIVKWLRDVPAFPERDRQNPLTVLPHDRLIQGHAKADVARLRPARAVAILLVPRRIPGIADSVVCEMACPLLRRSVPSIAG